MGDESKTQQQEKRTDEAPVSLKPNVPVGSKQEARGLQDAVASVNGEFLTETGKPNLSSYVSWNLRWVAYLTGSYFPITSKDREDRVREFLEERDRKFTAIAESQVRGLLGKGVLKKYVKNKTLLAELLEATKKALREAD